MRGEFDAAEVFGEQQNKLVKPLPILTKLEDFILEEPNEHDWLVEGLLGTGSTSLLCSAPKVGKTTLVYGLLKSICMGQTWLSRETVKSTCVGLFLEDKRDEVRSRFKAAELVGNENLFIFCGRPPKKPIHWLQKIVEQYQPGFIVADTWLRLCSSMVNDINCYNETTRVFDDLIEIARTSGSHLLFTHHLGKKGSGPSAILGSTGLFSSVDTVILLNNEKGSRSIQSIQRYGTDMKKQKLVFTPETMNLSFQDKEECTEQSILDLLSSSGPLPETQIIALTTGDTGIKRKALRHLVNIAQINRSGNGSKGSPYLYSYKCD